MNQPLRRVDPLGRSAPAIAYTPNNAWLTPASRGPAWPISNGSMRPIVDNLISNTTDRGGLVVRSRLDRRRYPTGKKVSEKELRELNIEPADFHGDWNYAIRPRQRAPD